MPETGKYRNMNRDQIKASLFKEVQEIRNKLYKADPTLSLCISDTQIKRNIDKKLDYFLKCREYADWKIENEKANNAYLKFEDIRINRDFYNSDNRLNNCELSNQTKTIETGQKQIKNIKSTIFYQPDKTPLLYIEKLKKLNERMEQK